MHALSVDPGFKPDMVRLLWGHIPAWDSKYRKD